MTAGQVRAAGWRRLGLGLACFVWALAVTASATGRADTGDTTAHLRKALAAPGPLVIDGEGLPKNRLVRLYAGRDTRPLWVEGGELTGRGWTALSLLRGSLEEGLDPAKYFAASIQALVAARSADGAVELELLISAGLLDYAAEVSAGRLEPKESDPELFAYPSPADPVVVLEGALRSPDFAAGVRALAPPHEAYRRLRATLTDYRVLADKGGWGSVPAGPKLERGDRGPRVESLWRRLATTGEVDAAAEPSDTFDSTLQAAVERFQARHGLLVDGIVGKQTFSALNTPVEARIRQIQINMERWRWLPRQLGARYVIINAANFELTAVEEGTPRLSMAVVVGRPYRRTPIFSEKIRYMVLNPDWIVPPSIARKDLLPKIQRDPGYLAREGYQVFNGWAEGAPRLDPQTIDWHAVSGRNFPYKLRQMPGANNALGRIKFMLPNRYSVYLHDTPSRELFDRSARPFSSGCVRLSRPIDFAEYVMAGAPGWDRAGIESAIGTGETRRVNVPVSLPVYFTYFTAWVDEVGNVHFRDDIYERDDALFAALIEQLIIQGSAPESE